MRQLLPKLLLVVALCLSTSACLTQKLLDDTRVYKERIDAAFISPDSRQLAVLGSNYDYVFSGADDLSALIKSDVHEKLHASMTMFTVGPDNIVRGGVILSMPAGDAGAEALAESLGLAGDGGTHLTRRIEISGTRYRKNPELHLLEAHKLNRAYEIDVREPANRTNARLLLTPVTVAADGVVMLFAVPVITFMLGRDIKSGG